MAVGTTCEAWHDTVGGWVSVSETVNEHCDDNPVVSYAEQTTGVFPTENAVPMAGVHEVLAINTLSVAVTAQEMFCLPKLRPSDVEIVAGH